MDETKLSMGLLLLETANMGCFAIYLTDGVYIECHWFCPQPNQYKNFKTPTPIKSTG